MHKLTHTLTHMLMHTLTHSLTCTHACTHTQEQVYYLTKTGWITGDSISLSFLYLFLYLLLYLRFISHFPLLSSMLLSLIHDPPFTLHVPPPFLQLFFHSPWGGGGHTSTQYENKCEDLQAFTQTNRYHCGLQ